KKLRFRSQSGFYGQVKVTYKITCSNDGTSAQGDAYINVGDKPDFIDDAECTVPSSPFVWDIGLKKQSLPVHYLSTPFTGDLDGDGSIEVVIPAKQSTGNNSDSMYVFNADLSLKYSFAITNTAGTAIDGLSNYFGHPYAIANVDHDDDGEILVTTRERKLRCYTQDGTLKWVSNDGAGNEVACSSEAGMTPVTADIDGDGEVEILAGDCIFDGSTGLLLVTLPGGTTPNGYAYGRGRRSQGGALAFYPVIADIDGDGVQEVVAGNTTYKVTVNRSNPALSTATVLAYVEQVDGMTSVADMDGDGILDVVVSQAHQATGTAGGTIPGATIYCWQGNTGAMIGAPINTGTPSGSRAFIGDIDGNGIPDICFTTNSRMWAYTYDSGASALVSLWTGKTTSDTSGATTMSMFDFDLNGEVELIYRDETHIRILDKDGNNVKDQLGNDAIFGCASATHSEYPIVVDLDGDGHAEILVSGAVNGENRTTQVRLLVYGSVTPNTWAPARQVWNAHGYNPLNINDDLSVPAHPMSPATIIARSDGSIHRPFNSFLQQAGNLNTEGENLNLSPDLSFQIGKNQKL
ncbi:FG-GAP repeat domain-containing protein, partial [Viscerimonas tarda]